MIEQQHLLRLFHYNSETGDLVWKERPVSDFRNKSAWRAWNSKYAGRVAGTTRPDGYRQVYISYRPYLAHTLIWMMVHGTWTEVDHQDRNRGNNRLVNLVGVSHSDNLKNQPLKKNNSSGVTGVTWDARNGKWRAQIMVSGKMLSLGRFADKSDAITARKVAERSNGFHPNHGRPL